MARTYQQVFHVLRIGACMTRQGKFSFLIRGLFQQVISRSFLISRFTYFGVWISFYHEGLATKVLHRSEHGLKAQLEFRARLFELIRGRL